MANANASVISYRDLRVWQCAMDVVERTYKLTAQFPKNEIYGLTAQIQRAAVSIPSNLAEGHARDSTKEYLYFVSVALGSIAELETQLNIAQRLGYVSTSQTESLFLEIDVVGKCCGRFRKL